MAAKQTLEQWLAKVNLAVEHLSGMSMHDLADCPYMDWYEKGMTPETAARKAIRNANN
jgi:hypothetical protein